MGIGQEPSASSAPSASPPPERVRAAPPPKLPPRATSGGASPTPRFGFQDGVESPDASPGQPPSSPVASDTSAPGPDYGSADSPVSAMCMVGELAPEPDDEAASFADSEEVPPDDTEGSIPDELTLLRAIQSHDAEYSRLQRKLRIQVPEGVREDRKVRVCLDNMQVELVIPEGSVAGDIVTCDRPLHAPLPSTEQKRIMLDEILLNQLHWWQTAEDSRYITDEACKQRKLDAYRRLRGRCMGLVLAPIEEAG